MRGFLFSKTFWTSFSYRLNTNFQLKLYKMSSILYLVAVVLVILWILGFANSYGGGLIHILLVIAVIAVILGIIRRA